MPLPDLHALEIAATVIATGSMSAAATQLGLTQSAVSQAVKRAETEVGAALVHRDRRPLVATEAGTILVAHIREMVLSAERVIEDVRRAAARPERQSLRLGMVDTFASTVGAYLIRELMETSVAVRIAASSGLAHAHAEALLRHELDVVISSDLMDEIDGLRRFPLLREPFVLVCPAEWSDKLRDRPVAAVLAEHRLIRYSARSHMGIQVERHLRRLGIEHPRTLSFDTSDALLAMVSGGIGVAITTPLCLVQGTGKRGPLAVLPFPKPGFSRELAVITRRGQLDTLGHYIAEIALRLLRLHADAETLSWITWHEAPTAAIA